MADQITDQVHLVVMDRGGLYGTYLNEDLALEVAQSIEAVVVSLPIRADYRKKPDHG